CRGTQKRGDARGARLRAPCAVAAAGQQKDAGRLPTQHTSIQQPPHMSNRNIPRYAWLRQQKDAGRLPTQHTSIQKPSAHEQPKHAT
ncbi:hypothetical protein, partial [Chimaeribacter arupi]|uniref:hypothetical protein n=1 Tax=Chimaeribacter arupi TaxID=2060066 RepID=UPI0019D4904A